MTFALGRARLPVWRPRRPRDRVLVALGVLLGVGLALRVWFLLVWSPALIGYSDSGVYFHGAVSSLWSDPIRTVGYSMFLRVLHFIAPHLLLVIIVQHLLGLLAAALIFLTVRRCGGPRALGLAPAAIIAIGGDQLFLEHAALSDSLFTFLVIAMLYCAVRSTQGGARWAAAAGACVGLGVWDRGAGVVMVPVITLWLLFSSGKPTRRTLAAGLLALVVSLATIQTYVEWRHAASGLTGLTTNNNWNLYTRVAPWADCRKFTPPPATRRLCEATPPSRRVPTDYVFGPASPAYRLFGPAFLVTKYPHAMSLLRRFSEAAILGQPLDYLHAVWRDAVRLFYPNRRSYGGLSPRELIGWLQYGPNMRSGSNEFVDYWRHRLYPHDPAPHRGAVGPLKRWERITRIDGVWMAILLVLALAGPWLAVSPTRAGAALFAATALTLIFFPIFVKDYDYRFLIPAFAPLLAAGALAVWGLYARLGVLLERRSRAARA